MSVYTWNITSKKKKLSDNQIAPHSNEFKVQSRFYRVVDLNALKIDGYAEKAIRKWVWHILWSIINAIFDVDENY